MKTGDLINDLAREGTRVRVTPPSLARFAVWAAASAVCLGFGVAALGVRADLSAELHSGFFLLQTALALCLAAVSACSALVLSVPGRATRLHTVAPGLLLFAWTVLIVGSLLFAGYTRSGQGLHCARNVVALTLVPGLLLYVTLRAAAPLRGGLVGFFAALAASVPGCLATRFVCHVDDPMHILVWHYLPVLGLSAIGCIIGRAVFNRNRPTTIAAPKP